MLIDPFTIFVQVINFVILLVALKLVLFDRIVRHMDQRQERITEQRRQAEARLAEAEERGRELDRRLAEIEHEREERLASAREEARERRQDLLEEARREVEEQRERWWRALEDEQEQFLGRIRARVGEQVLHISGRALHDLADAELEPQFVAAFERRIAALGPEETEELRGWLTDDQHPVVVSTAELSDEQRKRIAAIVRDIAAEDVSIDFRKDGALVGGLEIQAGGRAIGWTIDGYLEQVDDAIRETLSRKQEATSSAPSG